MAIISNPRQPRVCFSYAAYAKKIIHTLKSLDIPVEEGLSDIEFSALESNLKFSFPPDLRSILREGLPVAPGFPNWRSASPQQLEVQINLPVLGLCKEISRGGFWHDPWGSRPEDDNRAVILAKGFLKSVPVLVPIFRQFYIPSSPQSAGNPVFYVHGAEVEVWSFDLAGFFQRIDFQRGDERAAPRPRITGDSNDKAPAWAATRPWKIEFWTELAAEVEKSKAESGPGKVGLEECMGAAARRLAEGGWGEDDVRQMMDGCDREKIIDGDIISDWEGMTCHLRLLSRRLLRGGWCTNDVVDSLGFSDEDDCFRSFFLELSKM